MNNSNNKVRLRDMDPEVLLALHSGSITDIQNLLTKFFNKETDKVTKGNVAQSFVDFLKRYSDDEDQKIKTSLDAYRLKNTPIKESDLDATFDNKIENLIAQVNTLAGALAATDDTGKKIDISALLNRITSLQNEVNSLINMNSELTELKKTIQSLQNSLSDSSGIGGQAAQIQQLQSSIDSLNSKLSNYRLKEVKIAKTDFDNSLITQLSSFDNNIGILQKQIIQLMSTNYQKTADITIEANGSWSYETDDPNKYNIKVLVLDNESGSRTQGQYINSEGIITMSIKLPEALGTTKTPGKISLFNDSDSQVTVRIYYSTDDPQEKLDD